MTYAFGADVRTAPSATPPKGGVAPAVLATAKANPLVVWVNAHAKSPLTSGKAASIVKPMIQGLKALNRLNQATLATDTKALATVATAYKLGPQATASAFTTSQGVMSKLFFAEAKKALMAASVGVALKLPSQSPVASPIKFKVGTSPVKTKVTSATGKTGTLNLAAGKQTAPPSLVQIKLSAPPVVSPALGAKLQQVARVATDAQTRVYHSQGLSPVPGVLSIGYEEHEGLWMVSPVAEKIVLTALGSMQFTGDANGGQASVIAGPISGQALGAADSANQSGRAVLLEKASPATGSLRLVFAADPAQIVQLASGPGATHAILRDQPSELIAAALASLHGGALPETVVEEGLPSWVLPVGIGAGVVVVGVVVFMAMHKKKATPNRRRGRRRRHRR